MLKYKAKRPKSSGVKRREKTGARTKDNPCANTPLENTFKKFFIGSFSNKVFILFIQIPVSTKSKFRKKHRI